MYEIALIFYICKQRDLYYQLSKKPGVDNIVIKMCIEGKYKCILENNCMYQNQIISSTKSSKNYSIIVPINNNQKAIKCTDLENSLYL